jgi:serine/threonine protein phosphatase PrpC
MKPFTVEHIKERVAVIQQAASERDDEMAHMLETELHVDTLQAIADGHAGWDGADEVAKAALTSCEIVFARRHA